MKNLILLITAAALTSIEGAWKEKSNLWSGTGYTSTSPRLTTTQHKWTSLTSAAKTKGYIHRIKWCMKVDSGPSAPFDARLFDTNGAYIDNPKYTMIEYGMKDICTNKVIP